MKSTYLVTGGGGFIGSHIVRRLVSAGASVRVVDNFSTGKRIRLADFSARIDIVEGDLAEPSICARALEGIEYVFHQAAIPSVQRSIGDPVGTNRSNIVATLNLLEASRVANVKRFVYAASSSAYGDTEVLPKIEDMPANPLSPYALQKYVGERYCQLYFELYKLETICLRYFNVFGPSQDPHSEYSAVIPKFTTRLLKGEPLVVYGDGEQSRDFTYIENVVEANLAAVRVAGAGGRVINIGCGVQTTLNQIIHHLENIIGTEASVEYQPRRAGDVKHSLADLSLAKNLLGYEPKIDVATGLARTVDSLKANLF